MHRQTQGQGSCGAKSAYGGTDWHALEVQLTRTRTILQEILVHLQEVLNNLKMARGAARGGGASVRPEPGNGRAANHDARPGDAKFRAQTTPPPYGARDKRSPSGPTAAGKPHGTTAGASDRFRTRPRPGFEARAETGQGRAAGTPGPESARTQAGGTAAGEKARAGENASFRASATAGQGSREHTRAESAFRFRAGPAGPERDARQGHAAGQKTNTFAGQQAGSAAGASATGKPHARPSARPAAGFRLDRERQRRAREAARKSGMNLKCAYDILCLDYPCTVDEIKLAYRQMARLHHPDLGGDEEAMKDVNVAYELAMRFSAGRRTTTAWAV